jgi:tRNA nucleotidyltransferase (CCA-adding enzyme)
VTLEQDLARRDLTINAIAEDQDGTLIDPFGGQKDLQARKLCHVSPAFSEDPLRVLRLARFAAKLPDFAIAEETERLCKEMVEEQELSYLTKERVWQEWEKVWQTTQPARFISVLASLGAWQVVMPFCHSPDEDQKAVDALSGKIQDSRLFAVLGLYLAAEDYKRYHASLAVPVKVKELAKVVYTMSGQYTLWQQTPEKIVQLLQKVDATRRADRFIEAIELIGVLQGMPAHRKAWLSLQTALSDVRPEPEWLEENPKNIGQLLKEKKHRVVAEWQQEYSANQ